MKSRPTILVIVVIGIHVLASWLVCWQLKSGLPAQIAFGIALGELGLPAVLLGLAYRIPSLVRVLILVLCLDAVRRQCDDENYFVFMVFAAQVAALSLAWYCCTGWHLAPDEERPIEPRSGGKFSLRQLLTMTTAIAIALAAMRIRLGEIGVLGNGTWHEWLFLTSIAISSWLGTYGAFASRRTAIKTFGAAIVLCIIVAVVIHSTSSGGSMFVIVVAGSILNPVLPAIALRLCGWHWVRHERETLASESPERGEIS